MEYIVKGLNYDKNVNNNSPLNKEYLKMTNGTGDQVSWYENNYAEVGGTWYYQEESVSQIPVDDNNQLDTKPVGFENNIKHFFESLTSIVKK